MKASITITTGNRVDLVLKLDNGKKYLFLYDWETHTEIPLTNPQGLINALQTAVKEIEKGNVQ